MTPPRLVLKRTEEATQNIEIIRFPRTPSQGIPLNLFGGMNLIRFCVLIFGSPHFR